LGKTKGNLKGLGFATETKVAAKEAKMAQALRLLLGRDSVSGTLVLDLKLD
jgi:hypothetical protein